MKPLFNELSEARLQKAIDLMRERGEQYSDTMRLSQWTITRAVAKTLGINVTVEQARAIAVAGLCDVKHDRFEGGYREDNVDDGINYLSILPGLIELAKQSREKKSLIIWDDEFPLFGSVNFKKKYSIRCRPELDQYELNYYCGMQIGLFNKLDEAKSHAGKLEE